MKSADSGLQRFEVRLTADTHFWMASYSLERRTDHDVVDTDGRIVVGFGFAIVQFFERLQQMADVRAANYPKAPQYLGLALIASGILALVISIWQYRWSVRYMWSAPFTAVAGMRAGATKEQMQTPVVAIAILLMCIGLFAFFAVLLRQV